MAAAGTDDRAEAERGDDDTPLQEIAAGAVTLVTLGVAFGLLALGYPFFWVAFPIGFGGGLPLAVGLARWYESKEAESDDRAGRGRSETDTALDTLRDRYARGELTDDEFEDCVERLLETESVGDARATIERARATDDAGERGADEERAVEEERG